LSQSILTPKGFFQKISKGEIQPVYILTGNQTYLIDRAIERLKEAVLTSSADFNLSIFEGESASPEEIIETAKTYPMLSERRLVITKNAEKLPSEEIKLIEDYISFPSPTCCFVLIFGKDNKKLKTLRNKKEVVFVNFTIDAKELFEWIKSDAKKLKKEITQEATQALVSLLGEDLQNIHSELEKLVLFIGNKKTIDLEDVETLTAKLPLEKVFELVNRVAEKDKKGALAVAIELEPISKEPLMVLGLITRQLRLIWQAKELIDRKSSSSEISDKLGVSPKAVTYIINQAKRFSYEDIERSFSILFEVDKALKSSPLPEDLTFTKLILDLCL